jgi:formylglycine-generating enzyme required for sulfatase activity
MNLMTRLWITMAGVAGMCDQARGAEVTYWRIMGAETSMITAAGSDGYLSWSSPMDGQIENIQKATSLEPANWRHYTSVLHTGSVASYRVNAPEAADYLAIDLAAGPSASNYAVSYLGDTPGDVTDDYMTTKLLLRRIPGGTFIMGSPTNELGRENDETAHRVTLTKDYYIGVFEVTQKQWERVMGSWPSYFTNVDGRESRPVDSVSYCDIRENTNNSTMYPSWPLTNRVNENSFMGKLRTRTGLTSLDLPTEAQWEYACRAGTTTALNSGRGVTSTNSADEAMSALGRYRYNGYSLDPGVTTDAGTATVGSYQANAWGICDMHGNVREWCLDAYGAYPDMVTDPQGPFPTISYRMQRGGNFATRAGPCRSAARTPSVPYSRNAGFRIAMTLP